jgi:farnesyl-diphosphate farnesyltransferase
MERSDDGVLTDGFAPEQMLTSLLRDVSRSFYLTLRVLPARIRPQIGLAYLLARTTDTIADTELVTLDHRLGALQALKERIQGRHEARLDFGELARHQGSPTERTLLERTEASIKLLESFAPADRELVRTVLETITSGQELDLRRFAGASMERIIALQHDTELDDYTYRVAGCVGEFWTKICRAHLFPKSRLDDGALLRDAVRFGKGLQLVNILRDLPVDLRHGRCYLPAEGLAASGLAPGDLLEPSAEPCLRLLLNTWLDRAQSHLAAGWTYTNTLPRGCVRVRLACAWPLLIGRKTLMLLRSGNVLDPQQRIKISRPEVRKIIWRSVMYYPLPGLWRGLFQSAT